MGAHEEMYRENEPYARFLESWDPSFYAKYADTLNAGRGERVLDAGCGVGQVLQRLAAAGCEAHGVDVSHPNVERARAFSPQVQWYDGSRLPYAEDYFAAAGTLNVLEHVSEPERFLQELVRVVRPGGRLVVSSPNFFRVIGFRDYHPRMRGVRQKWRNWKRRRDKQAQIRSAPESVRFDRMEPVVRPVFAPDDDAIIATNPLEIAFFLERYGCKIQSISCTDRYVARPLEWILNATPLKQLMFNAFVVAQKKGAP